jgi:hypothetical protein
VLGALYVPGREERPLDEVGIVAEIGEHRGRHEPRAGVMCGPGAGFRQGQHRAVREAALAGALIEIVIHDEGHGYPSRGERVGTVKGHLRRVLQAG